MKVYHYTEVFYNRHVVALFEKSVRSSHWKCFIKKVLLKNFQTTLLKSHFDMSVLL